MRRLQVEVDITINGETFSHSFYTSFLDIVRLFLFGRPINITAHVNRGDWCEDEEGKRWRFSSVAQIL